MTSVPLRILLDANPVNGAPKSGTRRFWTNREIAVIRELYPSGGLSACLAQLPGRTATAIYQVARRQGLVKLTREGKPPSVRNRWTSTPHIDEAIRRAYQGEPTSGAISRLAATLGRPRRWINCRAQSLGVAVPRFKEVPWSEEELDLLAAQVSQHPAVIQRNFRKAGFARTATAIAVKLKRLRICVGAHGDDDHYTIAGLAEAFGCSQDTIRKWIKDGWLTAKKRKAVAQSAKPGDDGLMWRIDRRALRKFIVDNVAAVDFRKVDKFWFVDILTGGPR